MLQRNVATGSISDSSLDMSLTSRIEKEKASGAFLFEWRASGKTSQPLKPINADKPGRHYA